MLKIGWSKREISTDKPVLINGQMHARISKGVLDPIMLNCLVVDDETDIVIFLSGDFVAAGNTLDILRRKLAQRRPDIPGKKLVFNITHTHCGPPTRLNHVHNRIAHSVKEIYPTSAYMDFMTDMAVEAITEAFDGRKPGAIAYGYGYGVVAHSRRVTYFDDFSKREGHSGATSLYVDGHAVMYGDTNDTEFAGYEGGADPYVNLMYTFDMEKNLTGAIINVPCPSQNSEHESLLSADYWHDVRRLLQKKYGDIGILPQCAAAGDLSPRILHYNEAEARRFRLKYRDLPLDSRITRPIEKLRRLDIAERICNAFDEVLDWAKEELIFDARVQHSVKTIPLERRQIPQKLYEAECASLAELEANPPVPTGDPEEDYFNATVHAVGLNRYRTIIQRFKDRQESPLTNIESHIIQIGDIAFATNPFELYIDYQHRIQARSPFTQTFIVQLCGQPDGNFASGYLATQRAVENVGYSAAIYDNHVSPAGGDTLVEETLKALSSLHG